MPEEGGGVDGRTRQHRPPAQARQLLDAVPKVGRKRGPRLKALFACMYYAKCMDGQQAQINSKINDALGQ